MTLAHWPYPRWVAHRGAGKLAPENTLAALRLGAAQGYRMFECDVKLSADGVPFLLHDATLERTTSGQGTAGDVAWHELSLLDAGRWHSRAYAGEPLPTLDAIAAFVLGNGFDLNIEIKPTPGLGLHTGREVASHAAKLWQGQPRVPLLSSFDVPALQGALDRAPHLPRALLLDSLWDGWFETAMALACTAIVTNHRVMNEAVVQRASSGGLRCLVYTVNDAADAQRVLDLGVVGVITDAVDRFSPAAG